MPEWPPVYPCNPVGEGDVSGTFPAPPACVEVTVQPVEPPPPDPPAIPALPAAPGPPPPADVIVSKLNRHHCFEWLLRLDFLVHHHRQ